jgi:hypothetical protein
MRFIRIGFLLIWILGACSVAAHHAATGLYDRNNFGEIEGEVSSVIWRNPHVRIDITRVNDNDKVETWEVEFGSVNTVERLGVSRDVVKLGDRVRVSGNKGRDGLTVMFAKSISLSTGEEVPLNASVERRYGLSEEALRNARNTDAELRADIFRVWLPSKLPDTGAGATQYPLTEAGLAALTEWDPALDPALRCIPPGLPTAMDNPYPMEFIDKGDTITLLLEEWDGIRTIHMNKDGSREQVQPRMGYSIGRWDDNTLIVETTDINWRYIDDLGTPQSEDVVIVERFTLSPDGTRLDWEARITDPVNFSEPVVMQGIWLWVPGHEIKPFNCVLSEYAE